MIASRNIDYNKCIGCGMCVSDCVTHYLIMPTDETQEKKPILNPQSRCMDCGHCNAICSQDAISGGKAICEIDENNPLLKLMAYKRSVRHYKRGSHLSEEKLNAILFAGQTAPTGNNRKSARILLIKDTLPQVYGLALDYLESSMQDAGILGIFYAQTKEMAANRDIILNNAEYLVVFVGTPSTVIDAAISAERMQLAAYQYGVGSVYRGDMKLAINNSEPLREMLGIRPNESALLTFSMGETSIKYNKPAVKFNRKVEYR